MHQPVFFLYLVYQKLMIDNDQAEFKAIDMEFEDSDGNILSKKEYTDLQR